MKWGCKKTTLSSKVNGSLQRDARDYENASGRQGRFHGEVCALELGLGGLEMQGWNGRKGIAKPGKAETHTHTERERVPWAEET